MAWVNGLFFILTVQLVCGSRYDYASQHQHKPKTLVKVFYEALCPDCIHFVLNQLRPAVLALHDRIQVDYVPFGYATIKPDGTIKSQHGPAETLGNMIQVCAFHAAPLTELQKINYLTMEEQTHAATRGDLSCVRRAGISPQRVRQMISNGEAWDLLLRCQNSTKSLHPPSIPFVTIDDVPNEAATKNLMSVLLEKIK